MKFAVFGLALVLSSCVVVPTYPARRPGAPTTTAGPPASDGRSAADVTDPAPFDPVASYPAAPDRAAPSDSADEADAAGLTEDPNAPAADLEPRLARVSILGALIAPSKTDGRPWDGPGRVASGEMNQIAGLLGRRNAYTAVLAIVGRVAIDATAKPDPIGDAQLFAPDLVDQVSLPMTHRDTFTPSWSGAAFSRVPLRDSVRIRVTLRDKDLAADDPIGTVELTPRDLRAALRAGNVYPVEVAAQSANQLLFVNISVIAE